MHVLLKEACEYAGGVFESMDAMQTYLLRFMEGADKRFVIPVYQRNYDWKKEHCETLLDDLMSVYRNNTTSHFFGSIVYVGEDLA